jgi:purine-nucleoside phosphorylase
MTETVEFLRSRVKPGARVLLVLGSGLGDLADTMEDATRVPFVEIPGFAPIMVEGHRGLVVDGVLEGVHCLALQGRFHLYEGHPPERVVLPVRAAAALGVDTLIVTNAAGGLNRTFEVGDLMLIDDHINLMWRTPLMGRLQDGEVRFPDMSHPYDARLAATMESVALGRGIRLRRGVYCGLLGPSYETPAEVRMLQRLGADAVGMSTVPEVIAARALGMRVLGLSLITNPAAGLAPEPLGHDAVMAAGKRAASVFQTLVRDLLRHADLFGEPSDRQGRHPKGGGAT